MAKLELNNLMGNTWFISSGTNIGLYVKDNKVTLIDSGNDKEAARQVLNLINEKGWTLTGIVNTHSNADHIGGNAYLQERTNCKIYTTRMEAAFTNDTALEPSFLWGAYPFKELRNKFLEAKPSMVTNIIENNGVIDNTGLEAISLKGHYFDMIAVKTPDNIVFLGDCLFSETIVEKYSIFYLYDVKEFLLTLDNIKAIKAEIFVPSHARPTNKIDNLAEKNQSKVIEIAEKVMGICKDPICLESILKNVCEIYNITLNATQYVLLTSTIKAYLSYLSDEGKIEYYFEDGKMLWKQKYRLPSMTMEDTQ